MVPSTPPSPSPSMPTTRSSLRTLTPQATLSDLGDEKPANIVKPHHLQTPSAADLEKGVVADLGDLPPEPDVLDAEAKEAANDAFCVGWEVDDPENPQSWSRSRRWALTILSSTIAFTATFASSMPSGAVNQIKEELNASNFSTILVISIFVLGYAVGPLLWAPLSEVYGRRPIFILTFASYTLLIIPCALAPNIQTLLAVRFIGGVFAACSLTNSGGVVGDLWPPLERNRPFATFGITPSLGPTFGPVVTSFLAQYQGFRPAFWLLFTMSGLIFVSFYLWLPETYHPVLLRKKAERLRRETGDSRYWAKLEREDFGWKAMVSRIVARPILMLVLEPIVFLLSLYCAMVFGIIYLFFTMYPRLFAGHWDFSQGVSFLPLLPLGIGNVIACFTTVFYDAGYAKAVAANNGKPCPEERLRGLFVGGPMVAIGLIMFGAGADHHWIIPSLSGLFTGYGIFWVFQSALTYLGDCYLYYAASAFAAAQVFRSVFGFAFPLFATPMIDALGVPGTSYMLAGFAVLLCPIPFLFFKYGKRIRGVSRFAPE